MLSILKQLLNKLSKSHLTKYKKQQSLRAMPGGFVMKSVSFETTFAILLSSHSTGLYFPGPLVIGKDHSTRGNQTL